jgi:uncharacterized protein YcfL
MKRPLISFIILASLSFVGCTTNVNTVERAVPNARPERIEDRRIVTDRSLARKLEIIELNESQVAGNLLKVQALLGNTTNRERTFAYRFEWISEDGMMLSTPSGGWRVLTLQGGERTAVSAVATSPRAADFRLKLQER